MAAGPVASAGPIPATGAPLPMIHPLKLLTFVQYIDNRRYMESTHAIEVFAALSQSTRLDVFRLLMEHEPQGLPAGEIARRMDVPQNTMSSHLAILTRAGLIESERHSRSIVYRAVVDRVREIASFLVQDCCGGRPDLCEPLVAEFTPCCSPKESSHV